MKFSIFTGEKKSLYIAWTCFRNEISAGVQSLFFVLTVQVGFCRTGSDTYIVCWFSHVQAHFFSILFVLCFNYFINNVITGD